MSKAPVCQWWSGDETHHSIYPLCFLPSRNSGSGAQLGVRAFITMIIVVIIRQGSESQAGAKGRWRNPGSGLPARVLSLSLGPLPLPRQRTRAAFCTPFQGSEARSCSPLSTQLQDALDRESCAGGLPLCFLLEVGTSSSSQCFLPSSAHMGPENSHCPFPSWGRRPASNVHPRPTSWDPRHPPGIWQPTCSLIPGEGEEHERGFGLLSPCAPL